MQSVLNLYEYDTITEVILPAPRVIGNTIITGSEEVRYVAPMTLLLSACLQRFCEDIFWETSKRVLKLNDGNKKAFEASHGMWNNPSTEAIKNKLNRIGIFNIFADEDGMKNANTHKFFLNKLNRVRNDVAHGRLTEDYILEEDESFSFDFKVLRSKSIRFSVDINEFLDSEIERLT